MNNLQLLEYALEGVVAVRKKATTPQEKILLSKHVSIIVNKIQGEKRLKKIAEERGVRFD